MYSRFAGILADEMGLGKTMQAITTIRMLLCSGEVRNVLLVWFEERRGLVTSARGMFVSFGFSVAPLALAWLIAMGDWHQALWVLAFICLVFAGLALVFLRDNPAL